MSVVLHISDPHFGTERPGVVEALERLAYVQSPSLVILSGDITQRARKAEFSAAAAFLDRLAAPSRLVIPGNHDVPLFDLTGRLLWPYFRYRRAFGQDLEPVHDSRDLLVIGVRTTRRYRHIEGEVSTAQVERVARRLQQARPEQLRIVVTHQPVHVTRAEDREHLLRGRELAIATWANAGADLVLGGHIHRPFVVALHECRHAAASRPIWAVQAGTAVSDRIRHEVGNSVNVIRHQGACRVGHCAIERWDYKDGAGDFIMVESREIELSRTGSRAGVDGESPRSG